MDGRTTIINQEQKQRLLDIYATYFESNNEGDPVIAWNDFKEELIEVKKLFTIRDTIDYILPSEHGEKLTDWFYYWGCEATKEQRDKRFQTLWCSEIPIPYIMEELNFETEDDVLNTAHRLNLQYIVERNILTEKTVEERDKLVKGYEERGENGLTPKEEHNIYLESEEKNFTQTKIIEIVKRRHNREIHRQRVKNILKRGKRINELILRGNDFESLFS